LSDYYKDRVLDAVTIARGGGWWTAVVMIADPKTEKPFIGVYRWQSGETGWKTRKSIAFKSRKQVDAVMAALESLKKHLE